MDNYEEQFPVGSTIYYVFALPNPWINEYEVLGYGEFETTKAPCMFVYDKDLDWKTETSLQDANIIPNGYNNHRVFKTELAAETYKHSCVPLERDEPWNDFDWGML